MPARPPCRTGADAGDEGVHLAARRVDDLARGGEAVDLRVRRVLELAEHHVVLLADKLLRGVDRAGHALDRRGEQELDAEALEEATPLEAHVLRHREDELVALRRADHREADAGVAGRGLDEGVAGLDGALALRGLDHGERDPVLHGAGGVEHLELAEDLGGTGVTHAREAHEGGVTDEVEDGVGDGRLACRSLFGGYHWCSWELLLVMCVVSRQML